MESDTKVDEDFRSQFKAYQEQQQRRLQNLMEKKKEKQNRQKNTGSTRGTVKTLSDLNLFKKGPPVKEDASKSFLEAENEQLQDQLREVRDENCRLYKLVSEKDFEIKQLQKSVQEERLALSGASGLAGDVAATKIVELAKKNREVTAEFESERARVKQLNHKVKELERELQAAAEKIHSLGGGVAGMKESALKMLQGNLAESPEVKALQEKLNAANVKVTEYRNQLQNVKQELKLTQKILANEVGEDVNIQNLLTNSATWRGRAQQILLLQTKVRELEHKLSQNKIRASLLEMDEEFLPFADPRKLSVQEKNLLKIRSLEREKRESLEKLAGQHNALQKNHEELRKKLEASKARNQMLCGEVKMLKGQLGTLLEKGKHDDELIDALLTQQKQMQEILKGLSQKEDENKESRQMMGQHLNSEIQKQNSLIDQLRELVVEREAKVKVLEEQIGQLTHQDEAGAARPSPPEHSGASLELGSREAGRTESARKVSTMGHVLVESAATEPFLLRDTNSPGRSAGRDSQGWEITEHKALSQAAEVERNRLLELVTVLQERVEESSDQVLEAEQKLQEEQRRSDVMEQQLEMLQVDSGSRTTAQSPAMRSRRDSKLSKNNPRGGTAQSRVPLQKGDRDAAMSNLPLETQVEELSTRLEIQRDENEGLKAALEAAVRKREEDFLMYQVIMKQVKDKFSQAFQQHTQGKS